MGSVKTAQASWQERYAAERPRSRALAAQARAVLPGGVTHDLRAMQPFPFYVERAAGARKWDVDGHEYIDYLVGHGALLLGHGHPAVVAAVQEQVARGSHYGASHELELRWAEWVQRLVPSAERVRFVSSGTEAAMMAIRLARAVTGRPTLLKFHHHFHGWHDYGMVGLDPPFNQPSSPGIPEGVAASVIACEPTLCAVSEVLNRRADVAAVILEASGGHLGTYPLRPAFLEGLRTLTRERGVLLIFDEVVTGFRTAPGGLQALHDVRPDLTTLAKVLAGGLPGGAVAGRADILERLELRGDPQWDRYQHIYHPGTFNANPLSAAAALAALPIVATGEPQRHAERLATRLRSGLEAILAERGVPGGVYGPPTIFHVYLGSVEPPANTSADWLYTDDHARLEAMPNAVVHALRGLMLIRGIDWIRSSGLLSAAHTDADVDRTLEAFREALGELIELELVA